MTADTPRWAYRYEELEKIAQDLLAQRERGYPAQVAKGKMTQADADAGIATMAAIAADWHAVVTGKPLPAQTISQAVKRKTLEHASRRCAMIASAKPHDRDAAEYAELVETLLWQQQDYFSTSHIRWCHDLTLDLRAAYADRRGERSVAA